MFPTRRITTMGGDKFRDEFSLLFDGTNDHMTTGHGYEASPSTDYTYSCWLKFENVTGSSHKAIFGHGDDIQTAFHHYWTDTGGNAYKPIFYYGGSGNYIYFEAISEAGSIGNDGTWRHWCLTVDASAGENSDLYIDGVLQSKAASGSGVIAKAEPLTIGASARGASSGGCANFKCSDFAVYEGILTQAQIKNIYNSREPYNHKEGVASANLKAWWRMGDGSLDWGTYNEIYSIPTHQSTDYNSYPVGDETNATIGDELYTPSNALARLNNAEALTGLTLVEGGSDVSSGTASDYTVTGSEGDRYAIHIDTSNGSDLMNEDLNDFCSVASAYRLTVSARHSGSGDAWTIRLSSDSDGISSSGDIEIEDISSASDGTSWKNYVIYFIHSANTRYLVAREDGTNDNADVYISDLSIKKINGNAGCSVNIALTAKEGDTP